MPGGRQLGVLDAGSMRNAQAGCNTLLQPQAKAHKLPTPLTSTAGEHAYLPQTSSYASTPAAHTSTGGP
jgi:hypothetical protein